MQEKIINFFKDKNIAILGFGREGKSTYNFIRKHLPNMPLTIIDKNDLELNDELVTIVTGDNYLDDLDKYDIIMKTPGISFKDLDISSFKDKIYSELELLLMFNRENVIGITGTKGKSTTTSLIYNVLKEQVDDCLLAGNIGIPIFDLLDRITPKTTLVIEMSSHQLEFVKYSPHIGIILNLFEDHLDHAGSVEHYHACKLNMFKYQNVDDIGIYNSDNETLETKVLNSNFKSNLYPVSLNNQELYLDNGKRKLLGNHNLENILIVMKLASILNLDLDKSKKIIDEFPGLEHRLEYVGTYNDIIYYNDAIATIPEATIFGIEALGKVNTLIFGGMDRGIDYQDFEKYLSSCSVENLICMPTTGFKIADNLIKQNTDKKIFKADTLEEAVDIAKKVTKKEMICLMSPAASSYEYFKNFEEKGNFYKELVKK